VNQYNEITQNNDYSVTNNDNRSYNYNFNDTGIYESGDFLSGLWSGYSIPSRVMNRASSLQAGFSNKLGGQAFETLFSVKSEPLGKFCIENPIKTFSGYELPEFMGCIDFRELAKEDWVRLIRTVLLFMVVMYFVSSVYVVLRQY
jgi:hypothetical protein